MIAAPKRMQRSLIVAVSIVAIFTAGCSMMGMGDHDSMMHSKANLTGAQEVPANTSRASGVSTIRVSDDKAVSGTVTFNNMTATAAHIHNGAKGSNGPVIVPLTKTSETMFSVPAGAQLTDAQYASYKAGNLYVNVHSATYPGGEIRTQLNAQ